MPFDKAISVVWLTMSVLLLVLWASTSAAFTKLQAVNAITDNVDRFLSNESIKGHYPLPLISHWNTGQLANGFSPKYQSQLLSKGVPLFPWAQLPFPATPSIAHRKPPKKNYYQDVLRLVKADRLPISLVSTQWERLLVESEEFENSLHLTLPYPGADKKVLSPFGPVEDWYQVGQRWAQTSKLQFLISQYQNPPLVVFLSNNEQSKLRWYQVHSHREWLKKQILGNGRGLFSKKDFFQMWEQRYLALFSGFRQGLGNKQWQSAAQFVGYNNFVPTSLGRWKGWHKYSDHFEDVIAPWTSVWQGANVPYYLHDWNDIDDTGAWSPQVEAMGWQPTMEVVRQKNIPFWYEMSLWDGYSERNPKDKRFYFKTKGQRFDAERYQGLIRYGLWLTRPNVLREFRHWNQDRHAIESYFNAAIQSVSEVHEHKVLSRFWEKGVVLPNGDTKHPFNQLLPETITNQSRWFSHHLSEQERYRAFSLVIRSPDNDFLVYAYSPVSSGQVTQVTIEGIGTVDVPLFTKGSFHWVKPESDGVFVERVL